MLEQLEIDGCAALLQSGTYLYRVNLYLHHPQYSPFPSILGEGSKAS